MHVMPSSINFLVQYINWRSEICTSITHFWEISSEELVRMWSSSEKVEHVIRVGSLIISVNENVWQKSLHLLTKAEMDFLSSYDWFFLRINFPFWSKLILRSPRRLISLVLFSICWKISENAFKNHFAFGGLFW